MPMAPLFNIGILLSSEVPHTEVESAMQPVVAQVLDMFAKDDESG